MPALTPEESYLWLCARSWSDPAAANLGLLPQAENLQKLDWDRLLDIGLLNRMQGLLAHVWSVTGLERHLPPEAARRLSSAAARYQRQGEYLGEALRAYLHYAAQISQDVVVIKGLWLSDKIYGSTAIRPGSDIDILLSRRDIPASLSILEEKMGYGRWWRPLLDDAYYYRHHLHQQRCSPDRTIWVEPHWLLDHPYTRLTINFDELLNRTSPGELFGEPLREMAPVDLVSSLAIHLVKHAVYLPHAWQRRDLPRLILADGMLMYFVDIAEVLHVYTKKPPGEALDWAELLSLARRSGTLSILGPVLFVCRNLLGAPVPAEILAQFSGASGGAQQTKAPVLQPAREEYPALVGRIMNRLADHIIATYEGRETEPLWRFLLGYQETAVFRPIRLLDLLLYLFPGPDYLRRRYSSDGFAAAARHLLRASGQYVGTLLDTILFTARRRREVHRLDRQGYHWPELPVDSEPPAEES